MQVHGVQCAYPGWTEGHLRLGHAYGHPEENKANRKEEKGKRLLPHMTTILSAYYINQTTLQPITQHMILSAQVTGGILLFNNYFTTNEVPRCLRTPRPIRKERHQYTFIYPAAADIKALLGSVQSHATDDDINKVVHALKGKTLHQLITEGHSRLGGAATAPVVADKQQKNEKKEAPKK